ncbi:hypothetical protein [Planctobacterium marinum]|uniref:Uncharacterized protein n=1 Tax=Planctobacterium marinum TaxID=1631968 RepID=A0AA48HK93_9ALTE|nr:hypothetical protein MACH26_34920 [Planctobacterium marinum]
MSEKAIQQYLTRFAEPESRAVVCLLRQQFQYCLIIPAYRESPEFLKAVISQCRENSLLVILVINQPDNDSDVSPQVNLQQAALEAGALLAQQENLSLVSLTDTNCALLIIDRFSGGLAVPHKQGVGLARKIAMDVAVAAIQSGAVISQEIYSTDADSVLPADYFKPEHLDPDCSAGVFCFEHVSGDSESVNVATQLYQQRLQYYVDGLQYAGSPYAFHTIGSCLLVDMTAYCKVRGFPTRAAGEDFYLLNKLAKIGKVKALSPVVTIQSRISQRVPFGTGPAVEQIISDKLNADSYCVYEPQIFVQLKALLATLSATSVSDLASIENSLVVNEQSKAFLDSAGFFNTCAKWRKQNYTQPHFLKAISDWFDAFRTLKYVHYLRDNYYPDIPISQALAKAPWR